MAKLGLKASSVGYILLFLFIANQLFSSWTFAAFNDNSVPVVIQNDNQSDSIVSANYSASSGIANVSNVITVDPERPTPFANYGSVSADNFSGAATYNYSIDLPPGRLGLTPKVGLSYNSYRKNGWLGMGWLLDMGSIQRSTKYGVHYTGPGSNDFVFNSNGTVIELVPRNDWGVNYYCAYIEGEFTKYYFDTANNKWIVTTKDGTKYYYGTTAASRQYDPADTGRVFKWGLQKIQDTNGNFIRISYYKDQNEIYLDKIEYTGNGTLSPSNYVQFYLEQRDDTTVTYNTNFKVTTAYRLKAIEVKAADATGNYQLAKVYKLNYDRSINTGRSLLTSVQMFGTDALLDASGNITNESTASKLPPTTFQWTGQMDWHGTFIKSLPGASSATNSYLDTTHLSIRAGDWNGDGKTDLLHHQANSSPWTTTSNAVGQKSWVALSNGDGSFAFSKSLPDATLGNQSPLWNEYITDYSTTEWDYSIHNIVVGDWDGDGRTDMLHLMPLFQANDEIKSENPIYSWVGMSNGDGSFFFSNALPGSSASTNSYMRFNGQDIVTGDWNGDGKMDMLHLHPDPNKIYSWVALSNGDGTFTFSQSLPGASTGTKSYLTQPAISLEAIMYNNIVEGDWNGDGKMDMLHLHPDPNKIYSWVALSNGDGTFTFSQSLPGASSATNSYIDYSFFNIIPGDFNGDGLTDIIHLQPNNTGLTFSWVGLSKGDGTFDFQPLDRGTNSYLDINYNDIFSGDFNGDGLTDIIHLQPNNTGLAYSWVGLSKGDGTFDFQQLDRGTNSYLDASYYDIVAGDWNGDGKTDLLHLHPTYVLDYSWVMLSDGPIPDLLSVISNGYGKTTMTYEPSTSYPNNKMPFVVQTVSSITVEPGTKDKNENLIKAITDYTYEGGYYDFVEREFRGFGYVRQINPIPDSDSSQRTTLETWYHQRDDRNCFEDTANPSKNIAGVSVFKGRPCHMEFRDTWINDTPGDLLSESDYIWEKVAISGTSSEWVRLSQKGSYTVENNAVTAYTLEEYTDYDPANGYVRSMKKSGTDADPVTTATTYENQSSAGWVWRPKETSITGCKSYAPSGTTCTQGIVRKTTYQYYQNGKGNLWKEENWLEGGSNPYVEIQYDAYGNQTYVYDAIGSPTKIEYDPTKTYPIKITYPHTGDAAPAGVDHIVELKDYDYRFGKAKQNIDENLNTTTSIFDEFGRTVQIIFPDGGKTLTEYYDFAKPSYTINRVKETAAGPMIRTYSYSDGLGRPIQTITFGAAGESIITSTKYDNLGRVSRVDGPFFSAGVGYPKQLSAEYHWVQNEYDARGRIKTVTSSDKEYGQVDTTYSYGGLSTTILDPDNRKKTETKDFLGRVIQVTEHIGATLATTNYYYNAAGDLLFVVDFKDNVTSMTYDTLGRKTTMQDPDMLNWQYCYDANGNLVRQMDANGKIIKFSYDRLNRMLTKNYWGLLNSGIDPCLADETTDLVQLIGEKPVTFTYDIGPLSNGKGRLYLVTNRSGGSTTYDDYDAMGRVVQETVDVDGNRNLPSTTLMSYDFSGKLMRLTYPDDNYYVTYSYYPGTGLLKNVTGEDGVIYGEFTNYEPSGKFGTLSQNNGMITTNYTYDPMSSKLTNLVTNRSLGTAAVLQTKSYLYTKAGDINTITDHLPNPDVTYSYAYDVLHRLKSESNTGGYDGIGYTYYTIGNVATKTVGSNTFTYAYASPHKHAVSKITFGGQPYNFVYDNNGNMTDGWDFSDLTNIASRHIDYNADNLPVSITHAKYGLTTYKYDGEGRRVYKYHLGNETFYIGEHYKIANNVPIKYIFGGGLRLAKVAGTGTYFFHKDHLDSTAITTDTAGNVIERSAYQPFGENRTHTGTSVSEYYYTDQESDKETGLYNYNARLYDPVLGRFISADSIVQDPYDPQMLNRYAYVRNNPLIFVDPSGHSWESMDLYNFGGSASSWDYTWGSNGWTASYSSGNWNASFSFSQSMPSFSMPSFGEKQSSQRTITAVPGYPESGKMSWRSSNDAIFIDAVSSYNRSYGLSQGDSGFWTPERLKAQAMVESGGTRKAFLSDPLQVNNHGDWAPEKTKITGLSEYQAMTPILSAQGALKWLRYKGFSLDGTYKGDFSTLRGYNGSKTVHDDPTRGFDYHPYTQHRDWYAHQILLLEFLMRERK